MVYHWSVLDGFERLGVLDACAAGAIRTTGWTYVVRRTGERIPVDLAPIADDVAHPYNLLIAQETLTEALSAELARWGSSIDWGTTVTAIAQDADGVTVLAENEEGAHSYRAEWVVGADGARSIIRRDLGLAFAGMTWPDRFVATNMAFDFSSLGFDTAGYQVDPVLGAVVARVDSDRLWRYIFAESRTLPEETIGVRARSVLDEVLPAGSEAGISESFAYRIHQRSADRFRVGRALLVGDAAHLTNPALSLGMTSGLSDAYSLIEALGAVVVDGHDDEILNRYSETRRRNFWEYTSPASVAAKEFIFPAGAASQHDEVDRLRAMVADRAALRDHLLGGAACLPGSLLTGADRLQ